MLKDIDWRFVGSILEPSAGKGDLVDGVVSVIEKQYRYASNVIPEIECIEINSDLQNVLKGNSFEGKKEYEETVKDVEFYLPERPVMLLVEGAVV
jgi:hypothetical protein